jgi:hypothetical protein
MAPAQAPGPASRAVRAFASLGEPTIIFALLLAAALAPVLWFSLPAAMADYPNHLARMFVIARAGSAQAQPYYEVNWAIIPNLAMDLLVPPLGRLIGVETAMRLFYLASQLLVVSGAMAIERAVKGRVHIAGFAALMFLYSTPFAFGFVNFEFALGCALWGIAGALIVQERAWPVRLAAHAVIMAWLFTAHLFALGIYGFTIGLQELWRAWARRASWHETAGRLALMALPTLALTGIMLGSGGSVGGDGTQWYFGYKPAWLLHILSGYAMAPSAAGVIALFALLFALARRRALHFKQSGAWLLAGFAALYFAMPFRLFDTSYVDMRIPTAAALILPGFLSVSFPSRAWARGALAVAAAITLVNVAAVTSVWLSYRPDYAAAMDAFQHMERGAKLLIGDSGDAPDPPPDLRDYPIYNVGTLAVAYADGFVPSLFTERGKQPITVRPQWERLDVPYGNLVPVKLLKVVAERGAPAGTPRFIRSWARDFDYLFLLGPKIANPMPDRLVEVTRAPRFVLYRIRKEPSQ